MQTLFDFNNNKNNNKHQFQFRDATIKLTRMVTIIRRPIDNPN